MAFGGALALLAAEPARSQQTTQPGLAVPTVQAAARPSKRASFSAGWSDAGSGRAVPGAVVTLQGTGSTAEAEAMFQAGLIGLTARPGRQSAGHRRQRWPVRVPAAWARQLRARRACRRLCARLVRTAAAKRSFSPHRARTRPAGDGRDLKMWRYASIAGRLVDESGDAAVSASVTLVRVTLVSGRRRLASGGGATTDDRGHYRFGTLLPGSYLVQVRSSVTSLPPSVVEAYQRAIAAGTSGMNELPRELMMMGIPTSGVRVGDHLLQYGSRNRSIPAAATSQRRAAVHLSDDLLPGGRELGAGEPDHAVVGRGTHRHRHATETGAARSASREPSRGRMDRRT